MLLEHCKDLCLHETIQMSYSQLAAVVSYAILCILVLEHHNSPGVHLCVHSHVMQNIHHIHTQSLHHTQAYIVS